MKVTLLSCRGVPRSADSDLITGRGTFGERARETHPERSFRIRALTGNVFRVRAKMTPEKCSGYVITRVRAKLKTVFFRPLRVLPSSVEIIQVGRKADRVVSRKTRLCKLIFSIFLLI